MNRSRTRSRFTDPCVAAAGLEASAIGLTDADGKVLGEVVSEPGVKLDAGNMALDGIGDMTEELWAMVGNKGVRV
jgi:hypothetical protein